jgi:hypothetical protein
MLMGPELVQSAPLFAALDSPSSKPWPSDSVQRMTSLADGVIKDLTVFRSIKRQFRKVSKVSTPTAVDLLALMPPTRPLDTFARALQVDSERSAAKVTALRTSVHGNPATRCIAGEPTTEHLNLSPELPWRRSWRHPKARDLVEPALADQTIEGPTVDDKVKEDASASLVGGGAVSQGASQRELAPWTRTPRVVSDMLGHSTVALTLDTYSHAVPGLARQASDNLDRLLRG